MITEPASMPRELPRRGRDPGGRGVGLDPCRAATAARWLVVAALAFAPCLAAAPPDPRPLLETRLEARASLVSQLMTAAQVASTAPGLAAEERARIERLAQEGMDLIGAGRDGAASRVFYRAIAAGLGRDWTPRHEYARSLLLEARPTVADPAAEIQIELRQLWDVGWVPPGLLSARGRLVRNDRDAEPVALGSFEGIAADLVQWPWAFALPALGLEDGGFRVELELEEGGAPLRRVTAPLVVTNGLERARLEVERRLGVLEARPDTVASVRYPFERARYVNLGRVEPRRYDFPRGVAASRAILERLEQGVDPLWQGTGEIERHYLLEEAGEIVPYRLIVPESYDGSRAYPLVIAFHGGGGDQDTMALRPGGLTAALARRHGMIVLSPMGYRPDGGFGTLTPALPWAGPARLYRSRLAERDALTVIERVLGEYRIDPDRIYLVGHSGGGGAAWRFASLYPERWAAVAPISTLNTLEPEELARMRSLPVMLVHGDADLVAPLATAHLMVERMRALDMSYEYVEIEGAGHDTVDQALPGVFEFLARHRRGEAAPVGDRTGEAGVR